MQSMVYRQLINRDLPIQDQACGSKALYVSRREAQSFVRRGGYSNLEAYHCRYCDYWHAGHRRRRH